MASKQKRICEDFCNFLSKADEHKTSSTAIIIEKHIGKHRAYCGPQKLVIVIQSTSSFKIDDLDGHDRLSEQFKIKTWEMFA